MGEGATFRIAEPGGLGGGRRLMVVDAGAETRRAVAEYFSARGWEVSAAAGGVEALTAAIAGEIDVVIMSATLGDLEGYETAAILRRISPRTRVVLTVGSEPPASRESLHTERFRCFPRPLDLEAVASAIEEPETGQGAGAQRDEEGGR